MPEPFIGEIRVFAGNFAPRGWALCSGQLLPLAQNTALFSVIGVQYGGDGKNTFALPNLQGTAVMHQGTGPGLTPRSVGETGGSTSVTLMDAQMPAHDHRAMGNGTEDSAGTISAENHVWGTGGREGAPFYAPGTNPVAMSPMALGAAGGGQPHENRQPYLSLSFIIALEGVYPSRG